MIQRNINDDSTLAYLFNKLKGLVVNKSGDTMTGKLFVRSPEIDLNVIPSENIYFDGIALCDKNGNELGSVQLFQGTSGALGLALQARRTVNGTTTWHKLNMYTDTNGDPHVSFQYPAVWKDALGLTVSQTPTVSSIITPASGITIHNAQYVQCGNIAQIFVHWSSSSTISVGADGNITNRTVGTVVSGKRPKIMTTGTSYGDLGGPAFYYCNTDGTLEMGAVGGTGASRTIAAGTQFHCGMTYILP